MKFLLHPQSVDHTTVCWTSGHIEHGFGELDPCFQAPTFEEFDLHAFVCG
jgi:hypothetical protein